MILTCLQCRIFLDKPSDRKKFCSRKCQGRYQGQRSNFNRQLNPAWSSEEIDFLIQAYQIQIPIDVIAAQLDRPLYGVYIKASKLKLTDDHRPKQPQAIEVMRERMKKWWATLDREVVLHIVQHPCSEETKRKISEAGKRAYREGRHVITDEQRQIMSDNLKGLRIKDSRFGHPGTGTAGKREDIGFYVRSRWEANVARILKLRVESGEILDFIYESRRFEFEGIKRGVRSYLPDFQIILPSGDIEWIEVKGWWDQKSKVAVKRFAKFYPDEILHIIDAPAYAALAVEYQDYISEWEK